MKETHEDHIDRALRRLGTAAPREGIEARIAARLEEAAREKAPCFFNLPRLAAMFAAAGTLCAVIVAGSVTHSHRVLPIAPGLHLPAGDQAGLGQWTVALKEARRRSRWPR